MLGKVEGLDGIKTGFVCASGFNISTSAIRYDTNNKPRRLFAVVMGGTSWRSRDKRAAELLETNFRKIGAISAKPPKFLRAPGTKGIASKKERKKQVEIESTDLNNDLKEGAASKDAVLLEASLRENETFLEQQQPSFQDEEETRNRSAMMQSQMMQTVSYTPYPVIYPSQVQPTAYAAPQFSQPSTEHYSSYPVYANEAPPQAQTTAHPQTSDQMFEYLKSTESNQTHKKATPAIKKTAKKEKPSQSGIVSTSERKELPSQWVIPKPPSYKEISLSPAKKTSSFKKEKSISKKIWKKARSSRKKSV
jgi:hypothetical protein